MIALLPFSFKTNDPFLTEKQPVRHRETKCFSVRNESTDKALNLNQENCSSLLFSGASVVGICMLKYIPMIILSCLRYSNTE